MDYSQLSALETVIALLKQKEAPTPIMELISEALKIKGIEDKDGYYTTRLYVDITTSSDFVFCGEGKWNLKANESLDVYDRDGSYYGQKLSKEDEEEVEQLATNIAEDLDDNDEDRDEDEEERDEEDIQLYDDEELDMSDEDDDRDADKDYLDDLEEVDDYDEDKYNSIMDDYEDMYDN